MHSSSRSLTWWCYMYRGYEKPKVNKGYPAFVIRHFAATVEYNGTNMIEKNRDNLAGDIVAVMKVGWAAGCGLLACLWPILAHRLWQLPPL